MALVSNAFISAAIAQPVDLHQFVKQPPTVDSIPPALSPAIRVDVSNGSGAGTATISNGHQVFQFDAFAGDRVTLDVEVTETLPGNGYTDDDSHLFLFNSAGRLLAENDDDGSSYQSLIDAFAVPSTGTYFAVVTTWPNHPVLNEDQMVTSWSNDGSSHIRFNLLISGITSTK